jgi:enamine deaminase RidA (YjgF/YER057c/UK114 family)
MTMPHQHSRREIVRATAAVGTAFAAGLVVGGRSWVPFTFAQETSAMGPQKIAESLGITFEKQTPGYLNKCVRSGNLLITSGHTSKIKGKLGADLQVEQGAAAARECAVEILRSVWNTHGTLDGLKVLKVLGCVNCTPDFVDQPLVINGCSDLLHQVFGKETDGWHARSALGFASLPSGVAVEVEAIFEIKS